MEALKEHNVPQENFTLTEQIWRIFSSADYIEVVFINILDEIFSNFDGKPPEDLINAVTEYMDRAVGLSIKPRELAMIVRNIPSKELIEYYNEIRKNLGVSKLTQESYIKLPESRRICVELADIKAVADEIVRRYDKSRKFKLTSFINEKTASALHSTLSDKWLEVFWETEKDNQSIEDANDKAQLREKFQDMMVTGHILDINLSEDELKEQFINLDKWNWVIIRLPRSVSWVWIEKIKNEDELVNFCKKLADLEDWWSDLNYRITMESALLSDNFTSPSSQVYVYEDGTIDVLWVTDQILLNGTEHEWNVMVDNKYHPDLIEKITKVTKEICERYYKEYWVLGYSGVDFILVREEDADKNQLNNPEKTRVVINGDVYYLLVCEVNRRITWAYGSTMISNMFPAFSNNYICNINTIRYNYDENESFELIQDRIINRLRFNNLLFMPWEDTKREAYGVYPYAIHAWKIQLVFVAEDESHFEELRKDVESVLQDVGN